MEAFRQLDGSTSKDIEKYPQLLSEDVALFSIKPGYARAIMEGDKKFEFRRGKIKKEITAILIYASSPMRVLVGVAEVDCIIEASPTKLWQIAGDHGGISRKDFMTYFKGKSTGYAIKLKAIHRFEACVCPYEIIDGFRPPQSFMYIDDETRHKVYETVITNDQSGFRGRDTWSW